MSEFGISALFGLILGFMFGVGCAFAVLYTIYLGGYKKALEEGLLGRKSARYIESLEKVKTRLAKRKSSVFE
ncbi:hypothetical protein ACFPT7_20445 [Acidicapsa dinghuensis]|uniref:Uncharacterized protein n=1 Tax=Acidicapsa dinghuensis TaxID=2218256 RepID=A0ABW1EKZ4_9BACT|nr:hypothetical protein [Acidicapsa dinghuensis]